MRFLLEKGMSPNLERGMDDKTAIQFAIEDGSLEMVKLMLDHGFETKDSSVLQYAAKLWNVEILELLLDGGAGLEEVYRYYFPADVDYEGDPRGTAVYRVWRVGQVEAVRYLLGRGADER